MIELNVNGQQCLFDVEPDTPLLWVLRETLLLTRTKYGRGEGTCGSCNVLIGKKVVQSCSIAVAFVNEKEITTIEGLASDKGHPVVKAWLEEDVAQCGYWSANQEAAIFRFMISLICLPILNSILANVQSSGEYMTPISMPWNIVRL